MIALALRYWKALAVAALLAVTFGAGWRMASASYRTRIAVMEADYAKAAAQASAYYRKQETEAQTRVDQAEANHVERTQAIEARERAAVATAGSLRSALAAANSRATANPGAAREPDDAGRLRILLIELDQMAGASSAAADRYAEQITGLQQYIDAIRAE